MVASRGRSVRRTGNDSKYSIVIDHAAIGLSRHSPPTKKQLQTLSARLSQRSLRCFIQVDKVKIAHQFITNYLTESIDLGMSFSSTQAIDGIKTHQRGNGEI